LKSRLLIAEEGKQMKFVKHSFLRQSLLSLAVTLMATATCFAAGNDRIGIELVVFKPAAASGLASGSPSTMRFFLHRGESVDCVTNGLEMQNNNGARCIITSRSVDVSGLIRIRRIENDSIELAHGAHVVVLNDIGAAVPVQASLGELNAVALSRPLDARK